MPIPRIYCEQTLGPGAQFALAPQAARHAARSLRLKPGDTLALFDGRGGEYEATIARIENGRVDVKLGPWRELDREAPVAVGLVQGLPEADKMDWIIQKATELGVAWVQPVACERSVVRLSGERAERREAHWRRVAIAAAEQCGRTCVPEVRPTMPFPSWLASEGSAPRIVLEPVAPPLALREERPGALELVVGPEGGLSERERDAAASRGCATASLGPRVLRAETAPLAALAAIQALWGDFRRPIP